MARKKVDLSAITGKTVDDPIVFFCYKKQHSFSLPAFEIGDDGKFVLDSKKERIPLFEMVDPEKNIKRRVRKLFATAILPTTEKKTTNGKVVDYKSCFRLFRNDPYYEDLYKYLTAEAKRTESPIWDADEFNKREHPEAYRVAEQISAIKEDYESQIAKLQVENERLKRGK